MSSARPVGVTGRVVGWLLRWAEHPAGPAVLAALAVMEACLFPAPTEALFVALAVARPRRAWWLAGVAATASVVGGVVGYQLGAALFEQVGRRVLEWYGLSGQLDTLGALYRDNVYLALGTSGYTPIPYMLYSIAAGALDVPLGPFVLGSLVGRGIKYAILGALVYYLGPAVRAWLERHGGWVTVLAALLAVAAVLLLRG